MRAAVAGAVVPIVIAVSCTAPPRSTPMASDLIAAFAETRKQPAAESFAVTDATLGQRTRRVIAAAAPTRLTAHVTVPASGRFHVGIGVQPDAVRRPGTIAFMIGTSDGRSYRERYSTTIETTSGSNGRWRDVTVDLREYEGLTIDLILNVRSDQPPSNERVALWADPVVTGP